VTRSFLGPTGFSSTVGMKLPVAELRGILVIKVSICRLGRVKSEKEQETTSCIEFCVMNREDAKDYRGPSDQGFSQSSLLISACRRISFRRLSDISSF
ncbi:MAG: hypothetical protein WC560_12365, partial [Syntrophales bacterium]